MASNDTSVSAFYRQATYGLAVALFAVTMAFAGWTNSRDKGQDDKLDKHDARIRALEVVFADYSRHLTELEKKNSSDHQQLIDLLNEVKAAMQ